MNKMEHEAHRAGAPHEHRAATTALEVAAAWVLVGLPLAWGVWQVAVKSLDLFRR